MVLEKLDGVTGAYVNNDIALHFSEEIELDLAAVKSAISVSYTHLTLPTIYSV